MAIRPSRSRNGCDGFKNFLKSKNKCDGTTTVSQKDLHVLGREKLLGSSIERENILWLGQRERRKRRRNIAGYMVIIDRHAVRTFGVCVLAHNIVLPSLVK